MASLMPPLLLPPVTAYDSQERAVAGNQGRDRTGGIFGGFLGRKFWSRSAGWKPRGQGEAPGHSKGIILTDADNARCRELQRRPSH